MGTSLTRAQAIRLLGAFACTLPATLASARLARAAGLTAGAPAEGVSASASAAADAANPLAGLPEEPVARVAALCDMLAEQTEAFGAAYTEAMQAADGSYAAPMLAYADLCARAAEDARATLERMGQEPESVRLAARAALTTLDFYAGYYLSSDPLSQVQAQAAQGAYADEADLLDALYGAMGEVRANYESLALPAYMGQLWPLYVAQIGAYQEKIWADYVAAQRADVLMALSAQQLLARQPFVMWHYEAVMYALMRAQFQNSADTLRASGAGEGQARVFAECDAAPEVYPNLYPMSDSVANLALYTEGGSAEVLVEAQVEGFTQAYRQKLTVTPEISYLLVKPPVATDAADMTTERDAQLTLTVTNVSTGELVVQESRPLTLHSLYDFTLESTDFGVAEPYNVLAWLRPDAPEVLEVRRGAIDWLERNMGEGFDVLPGYQLGYPGEDEGQTTILQAAAIQGAISDLGVRYNVGSYSFGSFQRVLTPDAVVRQRSGICIETALLVASALQSADMHAMVLIVPGHAQVALESWSASGQYLLLETTLLPFTGADGQLGQFVSVLSNEEWASYLSQDGTYVIDCDLARELGIRGLAV